MIVLKVSFSNISKSSVSKSFLLFWSRLQKPCSQTKRAGVCVCVCVCVCAQLCLTLCNPKDWSPQGSFVCGIFQARILEWVAISRESSRPRDWTMSLASPALTGRFFTSSTTCGEPQEHCTVGLIWYSFWSLTYLFLRESLFFVAFLVCYEPILHTYLFIGCFRWRVSPVSASSLWRCETRMWWINDHKMFVLPSCGSTY